jgi:hypothetical protein
MIPAGIPAGPPSNASAAVKAAPPANPDAPTILNAIINRIAGAPTEAAIRTTSSNGSRLFTRYPFESTQDNTQWLL